VLAELMLTPDSDFGAMAELLQKSEDYRVLRRLKPRTIVTSDDGLPTKTGVLLDVETTGLNSRHDEVIELGMVKFTYLPDGTIVRVVDTFSSFREPSVAIPQEVVELTGITDEIVRGQKIDSNSVEAFVDGAVIVTAHNASFDRKFCERYWPIFAQRAWACSANEIDWRANGFAGSRLAYLLAGVGLFHQAHRAVDDCHAMLEILASELPKTKQPALASLLEHARRKTVRIWAEQSPYELKDELKKRKYRWGDGSDGGPRAWYVDVDEDKHTDELNYLKGSIYLREVELRTQAITAMDRYSTRA
jgi:DNA polymerase-3 subunit epsilon